MPSFKTMAATAALAALAVAAPTEKKRGTSFQLDQVSVGQKAPVNPAAVKAKAMAKFNMAVPSELAAAAATGSATASYVASEEYLVSVTVGSSTLSLDIDTGSSDLWVFGSQTPSSERSGKTLYQPSSSAKQASGETWEISYGDGSSASGIVYTDTVNLGGVTATGQAVEVATKVSSEFEQDASDGLMGFAFSSLNTIEKSGRADPQNTFFDNVSGSLSSPVLTALLKQSNAGSYGLGAVSSSYSPTYVDVDTSNGFWEFEVSSNSVTNEGFDAIADTGTTLMLVDDSIVDAYWDQVSGARYDSSQGVYSYRCGTDLPDMTLTIGGKKITVSGSTIAWLEDSGTCYGGIASNEGEPFAILGDVFLQNVYAVFENSATPRIGFDNQ